jgi:uncharacterized membrane protein YeaQ/YmgE (transglycosylase-associated protein family)
VSIIGWLLFGLVAGALARLLVPGRDAMGWIATILLGIAGSFVGGFLADALFDDESIGLVGAVIGAIILLLAWNAVTRNRGYARS